MSVFEKARILSSAGGFDSCGPKMCEVNINQGLGGIYHAKAENKDCRIFKTLMSNACAYDCKYCQNAAGVDKRPVAYEPEELSNIFMHLNKNLSVDGLFLSSGVTKDADSSTERMLEAVRLIRQKHGFKGYIHFKVLPGTSYELVKQASELSNRMSINIEAPNKEALSCLSTNKDYKKDILKRQAWVSRLNLSSGQTTQMILNNLSTDKDVLKMVRWEYDNLDMKRIYFSSFSPIKGTPLENEKPESDVRQNRLYNVDFLFRQYGFKPKEIESIMTDEMLPRTDPKLALAIQNNLKVDVDGATYEDLIRVPGIGPVTARKILETNISKYEHLNCLGANIEKAKPFIELNGQRQKMILEY